MAPSPRTISLGFARERVPEGTHLCLIFTSDQERTHALLSYLLSGLQSGDRCACFSDNVTEDEVRQFMQENGISYDERESSGAITLSAGSEVYFEGDRFEPQRMLDNLLRFYEEAIKADFQGARIIGEMSPEVERVTGGKRLLEYESRVSLLVKQHPITAVCQYDARVFDGATIMEILKVHPMMLVNGAVVRNPFYIEPEDYLRDCCQDE
ncbi:MEDS domain-containing protein [Pelagicoccus sp. SDUM812003]|uniref:MEDS domain-containing protein n=1 Tax=Pelagicoccus sp. SDUM812003 TaxID=3041267 RepID=UPI00280D64A6|nr:MEDS domain-containing protein [Pelagicoccus sp. SDUM812003]MDQ8203000.1 MEDS domain-containing protein [Pelagicoccus sp. SDUM812003]